jgi:regulator of RNase E activity RraA
MSGSGTSFDSAGAVRVERTMAALDADVLAQLSRGSASLIVDQDPQCLWLSADLSAVGPAESSRLCGQVLTVNSPAGDNVALRMAIDLVRPGQILLVAGKAYLERALIGEIMARQAVAHGAAGLVIDGAVRDRAHLAELPIPVFCRGTALRRATKLGYGEVGRPVAIANEVVYCGDVLIADADGIAIVPREAAARVGARIERALDYEADRMRKADAGSLDLGVSRVDQTGSTPA